jgi:TRAP-type C4-dicarboxylate transport system substrate-binding protein
MSPAAATTALQRGALDCVLGAPAWLRSYGYQDVAKHILNYPLGMVGPVLSVFLNRSTWNKMTEQQKMAHIKLMPKVVAISTIDAYILEDEKIVNNAAEKGVTLYKGGADIDKLVADFSATQDARVIADAKTLGVKNPEAVLGAYKKSLEKWMKLSKDIGRDNAKYEAALKREIYDKVDLSKL